jgi:hypothetical protein
MTGLHLCKVAVKQVRADEIAVDADWLAGIRRYQAVGKLSTSAPDTGY